MLKLFENDQIERITLVWALAFCLFQLFIPLFKIIQNPIIQIVLILIIAVVYASIQALISYYYSDSISLAVSGAHEAPRQDPFLQLHRIVENLAITAGLPKPKVYVINDPSPNAFATGRDPKHASVAVTTGLLQMMNIANFSYFV